MKYLPLNADIFIQNRKRFVGRMDKASIAIFNSNDELPTNGDAIHRFKQNSDLIWLTGIEQEDSMLILFPDNPILNTGKYWYWLDRMNSKKNGTVIA